MQRTHETILKSAEEIETLREVNARVLSILNDLENETKVGVATSELNALAMKRIQQYGVSPGYLGHGDPAFPAALMVSINNEVIAGIPDSSKIVGEGDLVSLQLCLEKDGLYGESIRTLAIEPIEANLADLVRVAEETLHHAIDACQIGNRTKEISRAIQNHVETNNFTVVSALVSSGIGHYMIEGPSIPNTHAQSVKRQPSEIMGD